MTNQMNTPAFQHHDNMSRRPHCVRARTSQTPRSSAADHPQLLSVLCFSSSLLFKTHSQALPPNAPTPRTPSHHPPPSVYLHNPPPTSHLCSLFLPLSLSPSLRRMVMEQTVLEGTCRKDAYPDSIRHASKFRHLSSAFLCSTPLSSAVTVGRPCGLAASPCVDLPC